MLSQPALIATDRVQANYRERITWPHMGRFLSYFGPQYNIDGRIEAVACRPIECELVPSARIWERC